MKKIIATFQINHIRDQLQQTAAYKTILIVNSGLQHIKQFLTLLHNTHNHGGEWSFSINRSGNMRTSTLYHPKEIAPFPSEIRGSALWLHAHRFSEHNQKHNQIAESISAFDLASTQYKNWGIGTAFKLFIEKAQANQHLWRTYTWGPNLSLLTDSKLVRPEDESASQLEIWEHAASTMFAATPHRLFEHVSEDELDYTKAQEQAIRSNLENIVRNFQPNLLAALKQSNAHNEYPFMDYRGPDYFDSNLISQLNKLDTNNKQAADELLLHISTFNFLNQELQELIQEIRTALK